MISIYIVSYKDNESLNVNLESLYSSNNFSLNNISVNIINNYTSEEILIEKKFLSSIKILNNLLRPDFSTGHLSRNWNQSIINGFENLLRPKNDIVITCQDDTIWEFDWYKKLQNIHKFYTFYTGDNGDGICSYKPEAIRNIGLWDEKFCGITHQEADYFLRALIHNNKFSSINDFWHKRTHNISELIAHRSTPKHNFRNHNGRHKYRNYTYKLFLHKWNNIDPENWTQDINLSIKPNIKDYMLYPYFEENINMYKYTSDVEKYK